MKFYYILIFSLLLFSCERNENDVKSKDILAEEIELTNEQIKNYDQNFFITPLSDIKYSDLEEARKYLNYNEKKDYYLKLLGKKVKWDGEVENISTGDYTIGNHHVTVEPPIAGSINVIHLFTNQDTKVLRSYIDSKVVFVGYVYKIGKGGEPFIKAMTIEEKEE